MSATEFYGGGPKPAPSAACPTCGHTALRSSGVDQFLSKIGLSEEMVNKLKTSVSNINFDEYVGTARDYLVAGSEKATSYVKENPAKVIAGVAVLAIGTALLVNALRD